MYGVSHNCVLIYRDLQSQKVLRLYTPTNPIFHTPVAYFVIGCKDDKEECRHPCFASPTNRYRPLIVKG
jgi:hypothetical protein